MTAVSGLKGKLRMVKKMAIEPGLEKTELKCVPAISKMAKELVSGQHTTSKEKFTKLLRLKLNKLLIDTTYENESSGTF